MTFSCQEGPKDMITNSDISAEKQNEPMREKTNKLGFRPGLIQTELYKYRRWLEACNFGFKKKRDCTIHVAKTKALISCADLRFCFRICRLLVLSCTGSNGFALELVSRINTGYNVFYK